MTVEQLLERSVSWMPDIAALRIGFLLLATALIAVIVNRVFGTFCRRLASKSKTDLDDQLIAWSERPIFISVLLIGLGVIFQGYLLELKRIWHPALITLAVMSWLSFVWRSSRLILTTLGRIGGRKGLVQPQTVHLFENVGKIVIGAGAAYLILNTWGVDITPLLGAAGIFGLAFGFAAKDTLANLISGVFILADTPYKIGDFVNLDSGERGKVTHIGLRSTRLLTRDDIEITLPNALIANSKIINESGGPSESERIRVQVSAAYGSDVDRVCEILEEIALSHEEIVRVPAPRVRFRRFGDSGLEFELLAWIKEPVLRGRLLHQMNMEVYKAFLGDGIEIPYPKQDVYIKEMPGQS